MKLDDLFFWKKRSEPTDATINTLNSRQLAEVERLIEESRGRTLLDVANTIHNVAGEPAPDIEPVVSNEITTTESLEIIKDYVKKNAEQIRLIEKLVEDRIQESDDKLNAFIEVVSERVSDDKEVADCFKQDGCPFDPKIRKCPMWMCRPVKNDAPSFCTPCRLQKQLAAKGM